MCYSQSFWMRESFAPRHDRAAWVAVGWAGRGPASHPACSDPREGPWLHAPISFSFCREEGEARPPRGLGGNARWGRGCHS